MFTFIYLFGVAFFDTLQIFVDITNQRFTVSICRPLNAIIFINTLKRKLMVN